MSNETSSTASAIPVPSSDEEVLRFLEQNYLVVYSDTQIDLECQSEDPYPCSKSFSLRHQKLDLTTLLWAVNHAVSHGAGRIKLDPDRHLFSEESIEASKERISYVKESRG